ncbi:MAG: zinc ABC transporter substrate-binding protein [Rectinemataceae bacterium]|jgi:zinc/manganese transport system substrate-binding protein
MKERLRVSARLWLTVLLLIISFGFLSATGTLRTDAIKVVAAENFYGNIAEQIGGERVEVTSILSDPNVDPHEYESNVDDARAIAESGLVIENGGGYDDWMDKLLSASPNGKRILLKGFDIAVTKLPDNEHVWYAVDNAQAIAQAIADGFSRIDPAGAQVYGKNLQVFGQSLGGIRQKIAQLKSKRGGTPVGLTETIFLYQAGPLGLKVLTPFEFQKSIAEGNDPPAETVAEAESQVKERKIKVLIYNEQTVTPITTKLQDEAKAAGIPILPVTETMPSALNYQNWMLSQLVALDLALGK